MLIVISVALTGVVSFTESASSLYRLIFPIAEHETKLSEPSTYTVDIMTLPATVNHGAQFSPHRLSLDLYSNGSTQRIEIVNFPVRKQVVWSPKKGKHVVLKIEIGNITLKKEYPGPLGFPEFLSEFFAGNRIFRPNEFDAATSETLTKMGVQFISVSFNIKGSEPILRYLSE